MEFSIVWYSTVQYSALLQHGTVLSYPYCTAIFPPIIFTPPEIEIQKWSDPEMTSSRNRNPEMEIQKWRHPEMEKIPVVIANVNGLHMKLVDMRAPAIIAKSKRRWHSFRSSSSTNKACQCNLPLFSKGWGEEQTIESPPVCPLAHIPGNYPVLQWSFDGWRGRVRGQTSVSHGLQNASQSRMLESTLGTLR